MTTWRDITTEAVQFEIDALVRVALGVAQEGLSTKGSLAHALVASDLGGNLEIERDMDTGPSETLTGRLYRTPTRFRVAAMISTGSGAGRDGLSIRVEHCEGVALELSVAYEVVGLSGEVAMGRVSSRVVDPELWVDDLVTAG